MNLGEKKGVLDNCCDMLRHGIRNLDHFQGGLEGFWLALLHHCIKTFPCIILLWHWGLFPLQTWRKKGFCTSGFLQSCWIFFRNFWKFLGIAAFASLPGGLTRILTSLFFGGCFRDRNPHMASHHLRWLVARGGVWSPPPGGQNFEVLNLEVAQELQVGTVGRLELAENRFFIMKNGSIWSWKTLLLKGPTHPFSTFSHDCGRFCVLIAKLGNSKNLSGFGLAFLGHHASGPWFVSVNF